jgi:FAD:protein FMN transferase
VNRLEAWLLHASTVALTITGIAYAWMRYLLEPMDPFSVVNHPLEPHMLSAHILFAPVLVVAFGAILHGHILFKIAAGSATARRSGLILIPTFAVMVISGYLLQVIASDFRKTLVIAHLGSGFVWIIIYAAHQVASFAQRRARFNGRTRFPVQVLALAILFAVTLSLDAAPFERRIYTMGTTLRVVMLEENQGKALRESEALIKVIEEADNQLSTWKETSELSRLNRSIPGEKFRLTESLFQLIQKIRQWTLSTNRAFDPGIGRLIQAWGVHDRFRVPSKVELSDALSRSGVQHLTLDERNRTVTKTKDILVDPGAFGKGEALDRAIEVARSLEMGPVLLDFGGQIAVHGTPKQKEWLAFVADPEDRFSVQDESLFLKTGSLSTSGFSERSGTIGKTIINHILDPATGLPAAQFGSITVWHKNALSADILSTALYVMGIDSGYKWALKNNIAAAFITDGKMLKTPEFVTQLMKAEKANQGNH